MRVGDEVCFGDLIEPWQEADFRALDPTWRMLALGVPSEQDAQTVYRRIWLQRPRGHSKTSDLAMQLMWLLKFSRRNLQGVIAAADREQAGLLLAGVKRLMQANPEQSEELEIKAQSVGNRQTGSRMSLISSDVGSSWGITPDLVVCDELCHWEKREMWESLCSSIAKTAGGVLIVLTNAGVGRDWQWDVKELARTSPDWYYSSLSGVQAPWISERVIDEQRRLLPPAVFDRLWNNLWQESRGSFVTRDEAARCEDDVLKIQQVGQRGVRYVAAIDYAEKRDYTVGVIVHRDGSKVVVDRMDVVVPDTDHPTPVKWVDAWMEQMAGCFPGVEFVVDEYQLLGTIQRLEGVYPVRRFEFASGRGNHELALLLRQLILQQEIAWPVGCGEISGGVQQDDLTSELASVELKHTSGGRVRIDHRHDGKSHDDRVFALGAACLTLVKSEARQEEWLEVDEDSWCVD